MGVYSAFTVTEAQDYTTVYKITIAFKYLLTSAITVLVLWSLWVLNDVARDSNYLIGNLPEIYKIATAFLLY